MRTPDRPVFDRSEWDLVRNAIIAVHEGDARAFKREFENLPTLTVYADRGVMYVGFGLRYQSIKRLLKVPTQQDLRELGETLDEQFHVFVPPEAISFTTLLESVWGFREPVEGSRSNGLLVYGCVGIAVLLDDPEHDLDEMESALREWFEESEEEFGEMLKRLETERPSRA